MKTMHLTGLLMVLLLAAFIPAVSAEDGILFVESTDAISGEFVPGWVVINGEYTTYLESGYGHISLEPGIYEVYVEPDNPLLYQASSMETIEVTDGSVPLYFAFMFPAASETGHIYVDLKDSDGNWVNLPVKVLLNGVDTGKTGNQGIHWLPFDCEYNVKVIMDGYTAEPQEQIVQLNEIEGLKIVTFTLTKETNPPIPTPEFPTTAIPAIFLIGMIGVIFLVRTRES